MYPHATRNTFIVLYDTVYNQAIPMTTLAIKIEIAACFVPRFQDTPKMNSRRCRDNQDRVDGLYTEKIVKYCSSRIEADTDAD